MSGDQNAKQVYKIKRSGKYCETVKEFKYFGTTLTDQNPIYEEIKSKLKSWKFPVAAYITFLVFSVRSIFPSRKSFRRQFLRKMWPIQLAYRILFLNLSFEPYCLEWSRGYPQISQSNVRILPRTRPWVFHSFFFISLSTNWPKTRCFRI